MLHHIFCSTFFAYVGSINIMNRIGGGVELDDPLKFPFFAQLLIPQYPSERQRISCGGALIDEEWVLTSGHCLPDDAKQLDWIIKLGTPVVFMGSTAAAALGNYPGKERPIIQIHRHPNYQHYKQQSKTYMGNDIAVIKLNSPFEKCPTIQTIALATTFGLCKYCLAIGAGRTDANNAQSKSKKVKYARMLIKELHELTFRPGNRKSNTTFFTESVIDDVKEGAGYTLKGDSGGPVICDVSPGQVPVLIGVNSAGVQLPRTKIVMSAVERVDLFIGFISEHVPKIELNKKKLTRRAKG